MKKPWIIFDWGRTLYDAENADLFPDTIEILEYLKNKYRLAIVSLAKKDGDIERRKAIVKEKDLEKYFEYIAFTDEDKDALYEKTVHQFKMKPEKTVIIDDRMFRGIQWGNKFGATTIWLQKGKFENELANEETGLPTFTIKNLKELRTIL
ncbi:MAG: HAD hydrolase-like protein [Candidatus Pacebacteria bacterium]|nr:HAD hydrolase-like protein [Candidatus Paceibacterota bacterium]